MGVCVCVCVVDSVVCRSLQELFEYIFSHLYILWCSMLKLTMIQVLAHGNQEAYKLAPLPPS